MSSPRVRTNSFPSCTFGLYTAISVWLLGFNLSCSLTRQHMPETVSVRKVNGLPRASFSRNLAVQALPLAMCLAPPPALRDFHPVEFAHAERTRKKPDNSTLIRLSNLGAVGETRTHTTFVTTPSRWRVYQFHHDGLAIKFFGAFDETRTHTTFVTTPSRWRVYQFHHEGTVFNSFFRFRLHQNRKMIFYLGI